MYTLDFGSYIQSGRERENEIAGSGGVATCQMTACINAELVRNTWNEQGSCSMH